MIPIDPTQSVSFTPPEPIVSQPSTRDEHAPPFTDYLADANRSRRTDRQEDRHTTSNDDHDHRQTTQDEVRDAGEAEAKPVERESVPVEEEQPQDTYESQEGVETDEAETSPAASTSSAEVDETATKDVEELDITEPVICTLHPGGCEETEIAEVKETVEGETTEQAVKATVGVPGEEVVDETTLTTTEVEVEGDGDGDSQTVTSTSDKETSPSKSQQNQLPEIAAGKPTGEAVLQEEDEKPAPAPPQGDRPSKSQDAEETVPQKPEANGPATNGPADHRPPETQVEHSRDDRPRRRRGNVRTEESQAVGAAESAKNNGAKLPDAMVQAGVANVSKPADEPSPELKTSTPQAAKPVVSPTGTAEAGPSAAGPRTPAALLTSPRDSGAHVESQTPADRSRFVQRVAKAFESAAQREGPVRLRLSPPELGQLKIEISIKQGVLTARMETETSEARHLLLDNLPQLRERLQEQSIKVEQFDVDVRDESQGNQAEQQSDKQGRRKSDEQAQSAESRDVENDADAGSHSAAPNVINDQLNIVI